MTIASGTRLGSYEILSLIGAGAMGEVYRARDTRLGRDVALKVLSPRLVQDPQAIARFEQEARALSALSHPHILHVYDVGTSELDSSTVRYIVMELIEGEPLSKLIRDPAVPLSRLVAWLTQVADGLAKAHDHGIAHRDLKPDNVMISRDGYAKILDFGLAKLLAGGDASADAPALGKPNATTPGILLGTVPYMAPEQALGNPADARADIFSFGCMLYEAAAQRRAFEGASAIDTLHRVVHDEPDYARLAPDMQAIVRRCLAKSPDARASSIRDVATELRALTGSPALERLAVPVSQPGWRPEPTLPTRAKIAVLPFEDLSPSRDSEYLAEGLAEEINSDLSGIDALCVLSRVAVRRLDKDLDRIAGELGAAYVIDGSVRRSGDRLRVTTQLVEARSATQLWSAKYDGTVADVFDIQERVARSIVEQLRIQLTPREDEALANRSVSNVAAWECYQRARMQLMRFDEQGLSAALKEIQNGLAIAGPNIALRAAEGYVHWQYYNAGVRPDPACLDTAETIAKEIMTLEPGSPHGHRLSGLVAVQRGLVSEGIAAMSRVLAMDPNDADALLYMCFLGDLRKRVDAGAHLRRLAEIDPLGPTTHLALAFHDAMRGRFADALPHAQRAHVLAEAVFGFFHVQLLVILGHVAEARAAARAMHALAPTDVFAGLAMALVHAVSGEIEAMRVALTEGVLRAARADLQHASWVAEIYASAGETELALEWLEHSIARGYTAWDYFAHFDRLLDRLRGDVRFDALLARARAEWES